MSQNTTAERGGEVPAQLQKKYAKLLKLAEKVTEARDKFDRAFDAAKYIKEGSELSPEWVKMCEAFDISPDSNEGDWLC